MSDSLKFILNSREVVNNVINRLLNVDISENTPLLCVEVSKCSDSRSKAQNRLMHSYFLQVSKARHLAGHNKYSPKVWKEFFKLEFLGEELIDLPGGRQILRTRRTRDLKVKEMCDFIDNVDNYAGSELNVFLHHTADYEIAMGVKE